MKIAEVIKYEGDNSTFVWKHPSEDFNCYSQLIVHESQEAIFFMNGQALDTFGPGRYTLETQNIPIIGKLLNRVFNDESPFHCEVYFINHTVQMSVKWGTDSKVRYIDPESGVPLALGASGEMNLQVLDGRKIITKLVGTMSGIAWGENGVNFTKSLSQSFRPLISTAVKSNLTPTIKASGISLFEVDEHLTELSGMLHKAILPGFEEYGMTIPQFYLTTIVLPEDDPNFRRLKELYTVSLQTRMAQAEATVRTAQAQAEADVTAARRAVELEKQTTQTEIAKREAERKIIEAQAAAQAAKLGGFAEAEVMAAKGYNQKDVFQTEVQKAYAEGMGNMGSNGGSAGGGVASDMISMMAGMKMAGAMMGQMDNIMPGFGTDQTQPQTQTAAPQTENTSTLKCVKCGADIPANSKFCLNCGEKVAPPVPEGMVVCPGCGKTVTKGKFCLECGYKFVSVCPTCGKELPDGAKFCLECGTKIN